MRRLKQCTGEKEGQKIISVTWASLASEQQELLWHYRHEWGKHLGLGVFIVQHPFLRQLEPRRLVFCPAQAMLPLYPDYSKSLMNPYTERGGNSEASPDIFSRADTHGSVNTLKESPLTCRAILFHCPQTMETEIVLFFFLLRDNCFTEFCYFLSNLNMNPP